MSLVDESEFHNFHKFGAARLPVLLAAHNKGIRDFPAAVCIPFKLDDSTAESLKPHTAHSADFGPTDSEIVPLVGGKRIIGI
jgi:hypothetical protein